MNVLIAIEFASAADYQRSLAIAIHRFDDVEENFEYCVSRERGLEAQLLRRSHIPFIAFVNSGEVLDSNVMLDDLDRAEWRVLRRSRSRNTGPVAGFEPLLTDEDNRIVERWPEVILEHERFLGRKMSYFSKDEFFSRLKADDLTYPTFIKGSDKGPFRNTSLRHVFHTAAELAEVFVPTESVPEHHRSRLNAEDPFSLRFQSPDWFCEYQGDMMRGMLNYVPVTTDIIVSEVMEIKRDNLGDSGTLEFRCFVFDGVVYNASRYTDYVSLPVPTALLEFASEFARVQKGVLPITYVVDIASTDEGYKVIELNQMPWSGRYLDNRPLFFYKAIHHYYNDGSTYQFVDPMEDPSDECFDDYSDELVSKFMAAQGKQLI